MNWEGVATQLKIVGIAILTAVLLLAAVSMLAGLDLPTDAVSGSGEVTVEDGSVYLDRAGRPTAVGAIDNDQRTAITNVSIRVQFYDGDEVIAERVTEPAAETTPAGATVPFSVRLGETDREPTHFEATISFTNAPDFEETLSVTDSEVRKTGSHSVTVGGTVSSTDEDPTPAAVVVTFYNEDGVVIGYRTSLVSPDPLRPAEEGEFQVRYVTLGDVPSLARTYDHYRIVVFER